MVGCIEFISLEIDVDECWVDYTQCYMRYTKMQSTNSRALTLDSSGYLSARISGDPFLLLPMRHRILLMFN